MAGMQGADAEGLDALALAIQAAANRLQSSALALGSALTRNPWAGSDAELFRQDWRTYHLPKLTSTAALLLDTVVVLHRNANEQRVASGDQPVSYGMADRRLAGGAVGRVSNNSAASAVSRLWKDTQKVAESVGRAEVSGLKQEWHDAVTGYGDVRAGYDDVVHSKQFTEFVNSRAFVDAMGAAHVVADIAPVAAMIIAPIAPEVAAGLYTAGLAANAVILVGDAAKMANTGKWDAVTLAGDGLSTLGSAATVGVLGKAAADASSGPGLKDLLNSDVQQFPKVVAQQVGEYGVVGEAVIMGKIASGFTTGISTTEKEVNDVRQGDWAGAGTDSLGYVDAVATTGGFDRVDAAEKVAQTLAKVVRAPIAAPASPVTYFLNEEAN